MTDDRKAPPTANLDDLLRIARERGHIRVEHTKSDKSLQGSYGHLGIIHDYRVLLTCNLSTLVLGHAGAGKSMGYFVPSILAADGVSLVVCDIKPELEQITKPHRAHVSQSMTLDWNAEDLTNQLRWNPLSPKCLPATGRADAFIDAIAQALIPDDPNNDAFWATSARSALSGLIGALVAKVNNHQDYSGIPKEWHGLEASLPMLVDWVTERVVEADTEERVTAWIGQVAEQAKAHGASDTTIYHLVGLAHQPPLQRGSVLATMSSRLAIFKHIAIRLTTSRCDLDFATLRGVRDDKSGKWKPVTVYLVNSQQSNTPIGALTTLLYDTMAAYLLSYGPNEVDGHGNQLGPYGVRFCMDEFPVLPKLHCINQIAATGRAKEVALDLAVQDLAQLSLHYTPKDIHDILNLIPVKVVYRQHEGPTAAAIADITAGALSASEVANIPFGFGYLLTPGFHSMPVLAEIGFYYEDPVLQKRAEHVKPKQEQSEAKPGLFARLAIAFRGEAPKR